MSTLFNGESSESEEDGLKVNNDYANNYNNWRQKEELNKLKTKYGNLNPSSGSSNEDSEESSDEEEETALNEQFDRDFYKALACLKKKDPKIYKEDVSFFSSTNKAEKKRSGEKQKPVFLRDYERKIIVERNGKYSDSEEEAPKEVTYVEEQRRLKDSFKTALLDDVEGSDLLKPKSKSQSEREQEEADYKQWLKGQQAKIDEVVEEELKPLRDFWNNPKLDSNEKFLRDYILNNKYLDKDRTTDEDHSRGLHDSDENLSEDERNIEKQEEFEHKYNFRYEEPDRDFIKRYPRTMENSLRKKDTRRSQKRAEVKQRKEEEKLRKKEELKQLKALKRKEIEEKIGKLKEITGNDDIQFNSIDLDGDFDPNEYDRKMSEIFNEDYYAGPEGDIKPEFPDVDAELEIEPTWDSYDPSAESNANDAPHCEDENFNMDADYDGTRAQEEELIDSSRRRKRKRRSKFAELISKEKPKFDPSQYPSYEEYFDRYYSLDYEDMIGDLPCRFKYRKVVPNDYGLSVDEILTADDKELNKWCSLKKALQYKPEHVELNEVRTFKQKANDEALKRRVLRSLYSASNEEETQNENDTVGSSQPENGSSKKKRRRNKKKAEETATTEEIQDKFGEKRKADKNAEPIAKKRDGVTEEPIASSEKSKKKRKKGKFNGKQSTESEILPIDAQRLKTYGINPKKLKKKLKYGK